MRRVAVCISRLYWGRGYARLRHRLACPKPRSSGRHRRKELSLFVYRRTHALEPRHLCQELFAMVTAADVTHLVQEGCRYLLRRQAATDVDGPAPDVVEPAMMLVRERRPPDLPPAKF